jgi:hypothetical protein
MPRFVASEDASQLGAQSLVTDSRLGWDLNVRIVAPHDGSHTRLSSEPRDFRIRSSVRWVLLALVLALGVAIVLTVVFRG